jgi:hypothetical protein
VRVRPPPPASKRAAGSDHTARAVRFLFRLTVREYQANDGSGKR